MRYYATSVITGERTKETNDQRKAHSLADERSQQTGEHWIVVDKDLFF